MKIISRHRDYYDRVQGLAHDDDLLYVREQKEMALRAYDGNESEVNKNQKLLDELLKCVQPGFPDVPHEFAGGYGPNISIVYVWFCKKIYVFYADFSLVAKSNDSFPRSFKTPDEVKSYVRNTYGRTGNMIVDKYEKRAARDVRKFGRAILDSLRADGLSRFFDERQYNEWTEKQKNFTVPLKPFLENSTPIFVYHKGIGNFSFSRDSHLNEVGFQKIVDPFAAYQEIDMFLGNDLARQNDPVMPVGGDIVLRDSKGFDEWSFKTRPGAKK